ncbi:Paraquat-inducible protein A [plant metagenome]|uniref:Paraquat-inducible protein A n=1 Tax=plant metagenome TaxID=1297885 RepID=A0A484TMJ2_9ZZZZ
MTRPAFRLRQGAGCEPMAIALPGFPQVFPALIACEHCDHLFKRSRLAPGRSAFCTRCGARLYTSTGLTIDQWLALAVTAAITLVIACLTPILGLSLLGMRTHATLWQVAATLLQNRMDRVAALLLLSIVLVPLAQVSLLIWVLAGIRYRVGTRRLIPALKLLAATGPWSMIEVCLSGVLVSSIKLSAATQVVIGPGLWALACLTFLMHGIAGRHIHWLWHFVRVEAPARTEAA